jgi:hypothetical protein
MDRATDAIYDHVVKWRFALSDDEVEEAHFEFFSNGDEDSP